MNADNESELTRILASLEEKRLALEGRRSTDADSVAGVAHAPRRFPRSATLRFIGDNPELSAGVAAACLVLGPRRVVRWASLALRWIAV